MKRKFDMLRPVTYIAILGFLCVSVIVAAYDIRIATYTLGVTIITMGYIIYKNLIFTKDVEKSLNEMGEIVATAHNETLDTFPLPVIICTDELEIMWSNELFVAEFGAQTEKFGNSITQIFAGITLDALSEKKPINIDYNEKKYTVIAVENVKDTKKAFALYFTEDTTLKNNADMYEKIKPVVMMMVVDNCEDIIQNSKDNEGRQLISKVEYTIRNYIKEHGGVLARTERDKFTVMLHQEALEKMIENKFSILDVVRQLVEGDASSATLSIGIGANDDDIQNVEQSARLALDMSLGRGGDQAAVKTATGYDFYGGISKGVEKRTRVKTRIVATALIEMINTHDNVIIMGHSFPDLDAFGAAVGLAKCISLMGKKVNIAIRKNKHLVSPLYERLEENGYADIFIAPEVAIETVNDKTLLIIVDTHIEKFLESPELYRACKDVVVIDHHRRMVNHIDNSVIFFHEPYASSASEMVAELVPYLTTANKGLTKLEADALLAGVTLDTKNFVIKTGVRTFEAAAYLKRCGADTVEVKKLFSTSIDDYRKRIKLVSMAEVYKNCAIVTTQSTEDIKVVSAQAADELLHIGGVDASFVIFEDAGRIAFSARSLGKVNVQIIMEGMDGGGHLTMAGSQIENISLEEGHQMLMDNIDKYYEDLNRAHN